MTDTNYLKSIMTLHGETVRQYCRKEKIQESNFGTKVRGQREFKQSDMAAFIQHYKLTPEQAFRAFFPDCLGGESA